MAAVRPTPTQPDTALDDSGQLYRLIAETIPHLVWTALPNGTTDYFNRRTQEYTGLEIRELAGWGWKDVVHPEDRERCLAAWSRALQSGERYDVEYRLRRADGNYRWHHSTALPFLGADGRVSRWFGTCTDIEDQLRSAQVLESMVEERTRALHESEQRFQLFMDHLPALAWIRDSNFRYTYVNRAFARFRGVPPSEMIGRDASHGLPPEVSERIRSTDRQVLEEGMPVQIIDGLPTGRWIKVKFPLTDAAGDVSVAGIAIDVSAQIEAEEKVRRHSGDVRRLLNRLVGAQEAERRRLADDMHDLIGQNLTALGLEIGALKAGLPESSRLAAAPRLAGMAGLVNDTIESIRGVMTGLRPPALEEFGLVPALRTYAAVFGERTGMKVNLNASGPDARLRRDTELALFRIAQEALTNAAKHSGGTSVEIAVTEFSGGVRLSVQDDGRGFTDAVGARGARQGGWGLHEMRERAEAHGGTLRIEFPGRGTRLIVEIPGADDD